MIFQGLFIDGFAGGGGASTGIAQAIGRHVDIAVNHSPAAIAIHKANHPTTQHYCQDIRAVWPKAVTRMEPVAGAWFSPDCKEFSKAKGGPVKDRSIRALADEVVIWLRDVRPTVAYLENVEEFEYAAPLDADGRPIKGQEGKAFKRHLRHWRAEGYRVKWRTLRACDYGAPTSRKRLYIVMRRDGLPIVWPKPTHGAPGSPGVRSGRLLPYRTAAECIDWSIPCASIFDRKRPLKPATLRRIAHGVMRYVVNAAEPFIVPVTNTSWNPGRTWSANEPLRTVTTAKGGEMAVADVQLAAHLNTNRNSAKPYTGANEPTHTVTAGGAHLNMVEATLVPHVTKFHSGSIGADVGEPMPTVTSNGDPARPAGATPLGMVGATLYRTRNGERTGQQPRALDVQKPLGTVAAEASGFGLACAAMTPLQNGQRREGERPREQDLRAPMSTIAAGGGKHAAVTAFLSSFYTSNTNGGRADPRKPLKTALAGANHHAVVAAHVEQANTGMVGHTPRRPLSTIVEKGCTQRIVETTMIEEGALPPAMLARAVEVAAFLVKYYATDGENEATQSQAVGRPLDTITTKARFAVVTVTIDAVTYVIVDIGLRMLKPRELARAQGFPDDYVLDPIVPKVKRGKLVHEPLTIAEQISAIGNSVCPPVARALVAANQPGIVQPEAMAA
jgi:DNA (cytosine-5)-methyltransferase 1